MSENMSPFFAVFNHHINNAGERAKKSFAAHFGAGVWAKRMKPYEKAGIMVIFKVKPNQYTKYWVDKVTEYVNET